MADFTIYIGEKNYSSWSLRGWLPIAHTGEDFAEVKLPLDTPEFYERIAEVSPVHTVPVLVHHREEGDVTVWDSLAIADYLARVCPDAGLWPDSDEAYGLARSITAEMHSGLSALRNACPMNMRANLAGKPFGPKTLKDIVRFDTLVQDARARFGAGGGFMFGAEPCVADFFFAPVASRCKTYGAPLSDVTQAWVDALFAHPLMVRWCADAAKETNIVPMDELDPSDETFGE